MATLYNSILTLCCLILLFTSSIAQSWQNVGTSGSCGKMDIDGSGNIYDLDLSSNYYNVHKFDGTNWSDIGNPFIGAGTNMTYYKDLSVSSTGVAYVTYHYGTMVPPNPAPTGIRSYISINSGSGWSILGTLASTETHFPCIDAETGYASMIDFTASPAKLYVKYYSGGNWLTKTSFNLDFGLYSNTAMAHDANGNCYMIINDNGIKLYKINASGVTQLGTTLSGYSTSGYKIPFCVTPDGTPYFGYIVNTANKKFGVGRFNGSTWDIVESDIITDPNTVTGLYDLTIEASASGIIYAGYLYTRSTGGDVAKVVYYSGSGVVWNEVGVQAFSDMESIKLSGNILYYEGCSKYDVTGITTDLEKAQETKDVTIYSDANGLNIKTTTAPSSISVYDIRGNLLTELQNSTEEFNKISLELDGIYIVKVQTQKGPYTQKVAFVK
jgi:hypothetical protein